jgi:hypothetical protein
MDRRSFWMSPKSCATTPAARPATAFYGLALLSAAAVLGTGCENNAIGRPCDVQQDGGAMQALVNAQALECPSRICFKPSRDQGVATTDTASYCTAECSKDSDCDGERRDPSNPRDHRCKSGFVCGVGVAVGSFCCKKICLCRDFLNQMGGLTSPSYCTKATSVCQNL